MDTYSMQVPKEAFIGIIEGRTPPDQPVLLLHMTFYRKREVDVPMLIGQSSTSSSLWSADAVRKWFGKGSSKYLYCRILHDQSPVISSGIQVICQN